MFLQVRRLQELPTYLLFTDLHQGFDVGWRDGMRFGLSQAGVTGRLYLFKDDQLAHDIVQVRLDSFVGPRKVVSEGTMQGRRTAVHELNLLMVPQVEEVERLAGGTALTPPDEAVAAWARSPVDLAPEKQTFPKPLVQDLL